RSGILAGYAASDMLDGRGDFACARYATIATRGFADYLPALAAHYAAVARWDTPFWQRRRSHVFHASSIVGGRSEVVSGRGARHL
ncbi:hypothetical protein NKI62_25960, partial [Mesorhizobium sp. M0488]